MKGTAFIRREADRWRQTGRKRYELNIKWKGKEMEERHNLRRRARKL